MYSFDCVDDFLWIMVPTVKLVNNKVVGNLLILLFIKVHGHSPNGLRVIAVRSLLSDLFVLWTDVKD